MSESPGGRLRLIPWGTVVAAILCGALLAWSLLAWLDRSGSNAPLTPWLLSVLLLAGGIGLLAWARRLRRMLDRRPDRLDPENAVAALACAKVALVAGAALCGFHIVYVLAFVRHMDIPLPRQRVIWGGAAIATSLFFGYAGRHLEKTCISPGGGSGEDGVAENGELPTG